MTTTSRMLLCVLGLALVVGVGQGKDDKAEGKEEWRAKALAINDLSGADPMRGKLKELLADKDGTKKLLSEAKALSRSSPQALNRNTTFILALVAEDLKEVDTAAHFYRINARQNLKLLSERAVGQAYVGLIQMYVNNKRYSDCEKVCDEFLKIEGEEDSAIERLKPMVLRRMILVIARQGAVDRATEKVDELIKEQPRNWLHRVLKAQVLREAEKYDEAAKTYLDVIDRVNSDRRLNKEEKEEFIDEYRYALSGIYVDLNQVEKAAEQLKLLLAREPNNPTYNNDLGYIWADHGMNLAESEKLIRKALDEDRKLRKKANPMLRPEEDKDNAAYLDSLGWVLFKQGKAKEARPHLMLAVKEREGQSLEVWAHLGDVHDALGEKAEAIAAYKKGLAAASDSKRDLKRKAEIEKKVKDLEEKRTAKKE